MKRNISKYIVYTSLALACNMCFLSGKSVDYLNHDALNHVNHVRQFHSSKLKPHENYDIKKHIKNYDNPKYRNKHPIKQDGIFKRGARAMKDAGKFFIGGTKWKDNVNPQNHIHGNGKLKSLGSGSQYPYGSNPRMNTSGNLYNTKSGMPRYNGINRSSNYTMDSMQRPGSYMTTKSMPGNDIANDTGMNTEMDIGTGISTSGNMPNSSVVRSALAGGLVNENDLNTDMGNGTGISTSSSIPGGMANGSGMSGGIGYNSNMVVSSGYSSISSSNILDGIAAANVLTKYYDILLNRKQPIPNITPISNILAYPVSDTEYVDYWGSISFIKNPSTGALVDSTGYFLGVPVESKEQILSLGDLTEIGLFQKKGMTPDELDKNYRTTKALIDEIASDTKQDVQSLHNERLPLKFMDGMMNYFNNKTAKLKEKKSCLTVCVCDNNTCSGPCKSIKCIEPMYLL
ncbi:hypothetical protein NEOKW01_1987 [Nematocida sp. AWRm80]|nr:hypothetical protein NEOKW01_1987 [Nematocida sp. AWRm80]